MIALRHTIKDNVGQLSKDISKVWAKDKDLEIIELQLPKSEKWW